MARVYNFSAGPSMLPEPVLRKAAGEMLEYSSSGQSVMEMSHRSREYMDIIQGCEALLREVMGIPDNYKVLFLQGGAATQFGMVPMNLMTGSGSADFMVTGQWAKKAAKEAKKFGKANVVASSEDEVFTYIPELDPQKCDPNADYFHICYNNTIYGTRFLAPPEVSVPLVADISSCILSQPMDVGKFALLYAGAQKNLGPAGVTVVIIREDLIGRAPESVPTMMDYKIHAENGSMYNTPPTYSIYMVGLVLQWLKELGGVEAIYAANLKKAGILYDFLDQSKLFRGTVKREFRSLMNVPFVTGSEELDKKFVAEAKAAGLVNLKGHRTVGGMRASIYNAMPLAGVQKLVDFMAAFEKGNG